MQNFKGESLDPVDWETSRAVAYRMVDEAIDHLADVRERAVWQPMPDDVRATFQTRLPVDPSPLDQVYED